MSLKIGSLVTVLQFPLSNSMIDYSYIISISFKNKKLCGYKSKIFLPFELFFYVKIKEFIFKLIIALPIDLEPNSTD
jgi:hypothetical protein